MTDREKAIVMAYTGVTMLTGDKFGVFHEYIEDKLGHPVWIHELASQEVCDKIKDVTRDDFLALCKGGEEQEPDYPVCERCGKQIDHVKINVFNYDGSDSEYCIPLHFDKPHGCVSFETSQNWTGYSLTDEEQKEDIRCPHCGKYPFNRSVEIEFYEPVEVLMWTSTDEQMEKVKLDG